MLSRGATLKSAGLSHWQVLSPRLLRPFRSMALRSQNSEQIYEPQYVAFERAIDAPVFSNGLKISGFSLLFVKAIYLSTSRRVNKRYLALITWAARKDVGKSFLINYQFNGGSLEPKPNGFFQLG